MNEYSNVKSYEFNSYLIRIKWQGGQRKLTDHFSHISKRYVARLAALCKTLLDIHLNRTVSVYTHIYTPQTYIKSLN